MECHDGMCNKCRGAKKLVVGALLLVNAFLWPRWLGIDGWVSFIAVLMLIGGLLKLAKPTCGHCGMSMAKPMPKKGKK